MIAGYFERNDGKLSMPERVAGERDEVGIRWGGPVGQGRDSVEGRSWAADYAVRVAQEGGVVERYGSVEDYDAALRRACRLE
jgi:hypothetical protein